MQSRLISIAVRYTYPCATPAVKDILKVVSGIVSYAVDTILMERLRTWNYKTVHLDGFPGKDWQVPKRPDCKLCGSGKDELQTTIPSEQTEGGRL